MKNEILPTEHFTLIHQQRILQYLRLSYGISQVNLAEIIGVSRFKILRAESAKSELSTREWWSLINYFNLDLDCLYRGFISLKNSDDPNTFKIPVRFSREAYSKGRDIQFHLENFRLIFNEKSIDDFFFQEDLNSLYLVNINNPLNINLNLKLLQKIIMKGHLNSEKKIHSYVQRGFKSGGHRFKKEDLFEGRGVQNIVKMINNIDQFEENHQYIIEDQTQSGQSVTISFRPKEHVNLKLYRYDPILKNILCPLIMNYFQAVANCSIFVSKHACFHQGDHFCTCTFSEAV